MRAFRLLPLRYRKRKGSVTTLEWRKRTVDATVRKTS